jgi:hypothetical protein
MSLIFQSLGQVKESLQKPIMECVITSERGYELGRDGLLLWLESWGPASLIRTLSNLNIVSGSRRDQKCQAIDDSVLEARWMCRVTCSECVETGCRCSPFISHPNTLTSSQIHRSALPVCDWSVAASHHYRCSMPPWTSFTSSLHRVWRICRIVIKKKKWMSHHHHHRLHHSSSHPQAMNPIFHSCVLSLYNIWPWSTLLPTPFIIRRVVLTSRIFQICLRVPWRWHHERVQFPGSLGFVCE